MKGEHPQTVMQSGNIPFHILKRNHRQAHMQSKETKSVGGLL